ncbi:MAG: polyphosphate kinase 1, partial [Proteobacteria bacterium]|nr:polyphosphate kinase 1 [Pseudomonadota bacterium]
FPPIQSRGLGMIVMHTPYNNTVYDNTVSYTILPFPPQLKRFIHLPENTKKHRYMSIENCLSMFLESLFPSRHIQGYGLFRLIRDSEMELTDDSSDLIQDFEQALKLRQFGKIIQLLVDKHMPDHLKFYLCEKLDINFEDILIIDGFLGVHALDHLVTNDRPDLLFKPYVPRLPQRLKTVDNDIFEAIHLKDMIIHHPYESFEVVQKFINQAAHDPHVLAIKQTLYRTGYDSPIVKALIKAAESGKSVTVLVEVKARFDEEINMKWAKHLEEAGVQVIYGLVGLKTHAKIALVLRQEDDKLCAYTHFGTGNYNPKTAKVYTDLSLFTADPVLGYEAGLIFNYMTGYVRPENIKEITYSPKGIRQKLLEFIEHEIRLAERKKPAYILAKINALTDEGLIQALYRASQKGVQIDLIVRGVCCLRPQMPKLSENIRVKSIIGRFLEHSRIFCFGNGHPFPSSYAKIFISSADWMQRNLDFRFEIMVPIKNETVHKQIIDQIIVANLKDQANSWKLHWDGSYIPFTSDFSGFDAQDYFMKNDSLSGRGLGVYMSSPRFKEKIE